MCHYNILSLHMSVILRDSWTMLLLLSRVVECGEVNRMTTQSIAIVFGPTLLRPEKEIGNIAVHMVYQNQIVELILTEYETVFGRSWNKLQMEHKFTKTHVWETRVCFKCFFFLYFQSTRKLCTCFPLVFKKIYVFSPPVESRCFA